MVLLLHLTFILPNNNTRQRNRQTDRREMSDSEFCIVEDVMAPVSSIDVEMCAKFKYTTVHSRLNMLSNSFSVFV